MVAHHYRLDPVPPLPAPQGKVLQALASVVPATVFILLLQPLAAPQVPEVLSGLPSPPLTTSCAYAE